ncbi:MAG: tetratricopeptide repeat protein [Hyphomonadaceae bacterium]
MKNKLILLGAVGAAALLAGCAQLGGAGQARCQSIFVYIPGADGGRVQPLSTCGGLPRDELAGTTLLAAHDEAGEGESDPALKTAEASVSAAARQTASPMKVAYSSPQEMLQAGDMSAFMARTRADFAADTNEGAWGFVIVDALVADDVALARTVATAMEGKPKPQFMSVAHLNPWVTAFEGDVESAAAEMDELSTALPSLTLSGHRALLAEGVGDTDGALEVYAKATENMSPPDPADAGTPVYLSRALAFNGQRRLLIRRAELLRAVGRNDEAIVLYEDLIAKSPDDAFAADRLEKAQKKQDAERVRTLKQAMAQALADEADLVDERQTIVGMMAGPGVDPPYNPLLSSLRQSALLLDPDNGDVRLQEVGALYDNGGFAGALKLAQLGDPPSQQRAALYSSASLAALELGAPDAAAELIEKGLKIDNSPEAKLAAAGALTNAGSTEKAIKLVDQALKGNLGDRQRIGALLTKAQAHYQAGDPDGAVSLAREAQALDPESGARDFLASMLIHTSAREEGLDIMREDLRKSPGDSGQMNNLGYALVNQTENPSELDEGFRLLKQAIRIAPNEPNLLDSMGWAYYQYGDFEAARKYVELALEAYKPFRNWELSEHMGDVLWRLDEKDAAREQWKDALIARPPAHERSEIEAKLRDGMLTPPPARRDTPEVPLNHRRRGSSDI